MAEATEMVPNFAGIAVKFDTAKNPFFRPIVEEALKKIASCATGKLLLEKIGKAKPKSRADFGVGVNVTVVPQPVSFVQAGHKQTWAASGGMDKTLVASADPRHSPKDCPFYLLGGSQNAAKDPTASGNKDGSVCTMYFTNVQVITSKGEATQPYIVLAHELIHSYHCVTGIRLDGPNEELWTTGIGAYATEAISENAIRGELGLPLRAEYF